MKRSVSITLNIDPEEYSHADDTPEGAVLLAMACLEGVADLPEEEITVCCEGVTKKVTYDR